MRAGLLRCAVVWSTAICAGCASGVAGWDPEDTPTGTEIDTGGSNLEVREALGADLRTASASISCRIPSTWDYPRLLEPQASVELTSDTGTVCFAHAEQVNDFCHWSNAFDVRYRAIRSCYAAALRRVDQLGLQAVGGSAARWSAVRELLLPAGWRASAPDDEQNAPMARWVSLLVRGVVEREPLSSMPLCFAHDAGVSGDEQVSSTLDALRWAWEMLRGEEQRVLGVLRRGIASGSDDGALAIALSVQILEEDRLPPPLAERCYFHPPAE